MIGTLMLVVTVLFRDGDFHVNGNDNDNGGRGVDYVKNHRSLGFIVSSRTEESLRHLLLLKNKIVQSTIHRIKQKLRKLEL
jgi:hypothetical protein